MTRVQREQAWWVVLVVGLIGLALAYVPRAEAQRASLSGIDEKLNEVLQALKFPPPGVRFVDNGDGTITDSQTGLMWAKQDDAGGLLDKDNVYTWDDAVGTFLVQLNSLSATNETDNATHVSFAGGYTDWRLPTIVELQTIIDTSIPGCNASPFTTPCVHAIFNTGCTPGCTTTAFNPEDACSCTAAAIYWSSSSRTTFPSVAWVVGFQFGLTAADGKDLLRRVYAVRGGR